MDQEEILALLEAIDLGAEVAEHEPELPKLFISDIEVYRRLLRDEVDLITGGKGSGKSAIYRMITETIIAEDLHVISAVNPAGSPEFRALFKGNDSERRLRSIWILYLTGQVCKYVIDTYGDHPASAKDVAELRETLELMGLRHPTRKVSLLERLRKAKSVDFGVSGGAAGFDLGASLKFEIEDGDDRSPRAAVVLGYADFFALIGKCADILNVHSCRVWVAIDRLDECFVRNSDGERRALRSLLRAVLDISSALSFGNTVRIKVFLRSDLFTIMSQDGAFTNATHLRRNDISWTFNSMADLISHRLMSSPAFQEAYLRGIDPMETTRTSWEALVPDISSGSEGRQFTASQTLCNWTVDGTGLFNPRNLISMVSLCLLRARENQRRALSMGRASRTRKPLINSGEIQAAIGELGRRRFQDTVANEFPTAAEWANKLKGGPSEYTTEELLKRLEFSPEPGPEGREAIGILVLSGLLRTLPGGKYRIPRLYGSALSTASRNRSSGRR